MADNAIVANPGVGGATFASDQIGGIEFPRAKLVWGADGTATDTSAAAPLPVVQTGTPALPTGAATEATLAAQSAKLPAALGQAAAAASLSVVLASDQPAQTLPTGAATAAKQPALGTAGTASADVITVQGKASMTPILTDGSATTQPVSLASVPSHAVTNAGTFATQATLAAETTKVIGTVNIAAAQSIAATNAGTFAVQATLAAGATSIGKAEDVASADADVGVPSMAVRKATPANTSGADGDYEFLQMAGGRLWVDASGKTLTVDGSGVTQPVSIASVPSHAVTNAGTFAVQAGQAAHDAAISGSPVRMAGRAGTSAYAAVADGDTADLLTTILGKLITLPYCLPGAAWKYVGAAGGIVNTTAITIKAAGGAGVINYITSITLVNSHQTIGTEVIINDGAAGTVIFRTWCQFAGGGVSIKCDPPIPSTANTLLEIKEITATGTAGIVAEILGYSAAE